MKKKKAQIGILAEGRELGDRAAPGGRGGDTAGVTRCCRDVGAVRGHRGGGTARGATRGVFGNGSTKALGLGTVRARECKDGTRNLGMEP